MIVLLAISFCLFITAVLYASHRFRNHKSVFNEYLLLILFLSVLFSKFAFSVLENEPKVFTFGVIHTLQSFSLDEDYFEFINSSQNISSDFLGNLIKLYFSALSILAPVCGGAFIIDVLTDIFPKLRFRLIKRFSKNYFVFSELNDESLYLGKSIKETKKRAKLIYTDVYNSRSDEPKSELIYEAKSIGALCLKDDISNLWPEKPKHKVCRRKKSNRRIVFFIVDKARDNINEMVALFVNDRAKSVGNADVYVFSNDIGYSELFGRACERVAEISNERVNIFRKNVSRMLIFDILQKYPLYSPLKSAPDKHEFNLTIVGSNDIAFEMFLNSYWCGQMSDIKLKINMISSENEDAFIERINKISPEILESGKDRSELLEINYEKTDYAKPYFSFRYIPEDMSIIRVEKIDREYDNVISDSDYIFISLENDDDNINLYRDILRYNHIIESSKNTEVVFIVKDPKINHVIADVKGLSDKNVKGYVAGSTALIYNYQNLQDDNGIAKIYTKAYNLNSINGNSEEVLKKRYGYKSDFARAIHLRYRAFSAMRLNNVDCADMSDEEMIEKYFVLLENDKLKADKGSLHANLRWLEHRRWNANLRTRGYVYKLETDKKETKKIGMKTHSCLVECYNDAIYDGKSNDKLDKSVKKWDDPVKFDLNHKEKILSELRKAKTN